MEDQSDVGSLREIALVAVRQRRLILSVYLGTLATAVVGMFLLTPQYRAAAKILLTSNRAQISTSAERPTELVRASQVGESELSSQLEILRSRELVEGVLKDLGVQGEASEAEGPGIVRSIIGAPMALLRAAYRRLHGLEDLEPSSPLYWAAKELAASLEVGALGNSNVVEIALTDPDPTFAREFVNHLTTAYVERQAELQSQAQAERFFIEQSELLQKKLAESEAGLRAVREKAGTLAGRHAEIQERLGEFSGDLARTKIARAELEEKVAFLQADRRSGRVASPELLALEGKRAELLGRYRPDSERVREIDQQIQTLRAAVASYGTVSSDGSSSAAGETNLTAARASLVALRGKEQALARATEEYRGKAELLEAQGFDLARLERQVKLDEQAYLSYVRTAEESRLSNAIERSKMLRLTVLEPAALPMEPVSPRKGRILMFALIGGLAVSLGCGFARDRLDTTLKTATDVRRHAALDVLAVLPEQRSA